MRTKKLLEKADLLSTIMAAASRIRLVDIHGWINHCISFFF
jgi:hypothetical protein